MNTVSRPRFDLSVYRARPWYHDFASVGIQTNFEHNLPFLLRLFNAAKQSFRKQPEQLNLRGIQHVRNQRDKEEFILPFLTDAVNYVSAEHDSSSSFLEMFCADGFYSFWLKRNFTYATTVSVDIDPSDIRRCMLMKEVLGFTDMEFRVSDVYDIPEHEHYDIVLCAGGLYHVSDPLRLLTRCYEMSRFLVVQSVVTLSTESSDYFVTPAPGWKHGCRFTDSWLRSRLEDVGWIIVKHVTNELSGNERPHDRGSAYYLCRRTA